MNPVSRNLGLWLLLLLMGLLLWSIVTKQQPREPEVSFSRFIAGGRGGPGRRGHDPGPATSAAATRASTATPARASRPSPRRTRIWSALLREKGVEIEAQPEDAEPWYVVALVQWAPMLLLIGVWVFFMRQMQVGGGKAMSFGKSRAKLLTENQNKVTFDDVAGIDEAKEELEEIIAFLKDPKKFTKLGGRIPKGVLLIGPPGTGKTLLARAIAGEAGVPFFSISGSDFVEMFVGVGASRVRDLFEQGKKNAPCIIFIDEIDAVGRHRGAGLGGGHDEREQTLNQLLVEMDGFESNEGVILIAATNRPDVLDPGAAAPGPLRPPRRRAAPRREGPRGHPPRAHAPGAARRRRRPRAARARTPGFSGADLENLVNEAALLAARKQQGQGRHGRLRARQGQGPDGRRAQVDDHQPRGEAQHRLPRGRPRAGRRSCCPAPIRCTR